MAYLIDGKTQARQPLKNLGWLLRNWKRVECFSFEFGPHGYTDNDGMLTAFLRNDNTRYITTFADVTVLWRWLDRPVFQGLRLQITNSATLVQSGWEIGSDAYRRMGQLPRECLVRLM